MSYAARFALVVPLLFAAGHSALAIREFDIRTIESLGRKLYEKAQQGSGSHSELEQRAAGIVLGQVVSNKPVETLVYLTLRHRVPCMIVTPDESVWWIESGKITKDKKKASEFEPGDLQ
ncbi:MAG TPA: hypothetical protein VM940_02615 [Chthoniobacterales bacterium]|jgi:hypothetical protein|nr:hypothetical protein [Chthoniobacterales bacterium]